MANAGKNTNTSQFFIVLTDNASKLAKISGKYVVFGQVVDECLGLLERLNDVGVEEGKPRLPIWIGGCGLED